MRMFTASVVLASLISFVPPCFASNDSDQAQEMSGYSAISAIAAPAVFSDATASAAVAGTKQIVRLVDKGGKAIGELTSDAIDNFGTIDDSDAPKVTVDKKQIPLVVRGDYVEMNEKVKTE